MENDSKIRAVLFDLGGTLIKTAEPPEIFMRILAHYGVQVPLDGIVKAHTMNQKEFDHEKMATMGSKYWVNWNLTLLNRVGIRENAEFLARKIDELWFEFGGLQVYPDVVRTLTELKARNVKIGVVTNACERDVQKVLKKLELKVYFDVVVSTDACKKAKPDKQIFLHTLKKLCVPPERALFVGDSLEHDYEASRRVGLKPLLINRNVSAQGKVEEIRSLTEVLNYIA